MTTPSDRDIAADFVALAIDPAIPYTRAISLIADRVAEIRVSASPSVASPNPLGGGRMKNPREVAPSLAGAQLEKEETAC